NDVGVFSILNRDDSRQKLDNPISHKIGKGGFSIAKIAQDEKGNVVLISKIKTSARFNPPIPFIQNNIHQTWSKLKRPCYSAVFGNKFYVVSDYIPVITFAKYINSDFYGHSNSRKIGYALKLAIAVKEFHDLKIIHGDIKPENVILDIRTG